MSNRMKNKERKALNRLAYLFTEFDPSMLLGRELRAWEPGADFFRFPRPEVSDPVESFKLIDDVRKDAERIMLQDTRGWRRLRREAYETHYAAEVFRRLEIIRKHIAAGDAAMAVYHAFYAGVAATKMRVSVPHLHLMELGLRAIRGGKTSADILRSHRDAERDRIRLRCLDLTAQYGKREAAVEQCTREFHVSRAKVFRCLKQKKERKPSLNNSH